MAGFFCAEFFRSGVPKKAVAKAVREGWGMEPTERFFKRVVLFLISAQSSLLRIEIRQRIGTLLFFGFQNLTAGISLLQLCDGGKHALRFDKDVANDAAALRLDLEDELLEATGLGFGTPTGEARQHHSHEGSAFHVNLPR